MPVLCEVEGPLLLNIPCLYGHSKPGNITVDRLILRNMNDAHAHDP